MTLASKGPNWRMLNLSVYDKTSFAYLDCCDLGMEVYNTVWGIVVVIVIPATQIAKCDDSSTSVTTNLWSLTNVSAF